MIHSTNTVNIDGAAIKAIDLGSVLSGKSEDKLSRWVVRPLALLAAIGLGIAALLASAFLLVVSLALLPIVAIAMWAMKSKVERDLQNTESVIELGDEAAASAHGKVAG